MKKQAFLSFLLLILFNSIGYSQVTVSKDPITALESKISDLEQLSSVLSDSLDLIRSKIDSLEGVIATIKFENLKSKKIILTLKSESDIYKSNHISSSAIGFIPEDSKVVFIEVANPHFVKVNYQDKIGYVPTWHFKEEETVNQLFAKHEIEEEKKAAYVDSLIASVEVNKNWIKTFKANLRIKPTTDSNIIKQLQKGDVVFVQQKNDEWLKIRHLIRLGYKDKINNKKDLNLAYETGWIHNSLISDQYIDPLSDAETRRRNFVQENPNIKVQYKNTILKGRIRIGMTKEMVVASWGYPDDINRTVTSYSTKEQWIYGSISNRTYIYFEDGIMTSFQD